MDPGTLVWIFVIVEGTTLLLVLSAIVAVSIKTPFVV